MNGGAVSRRRLGCGALIATLVPVVVAACGDDAATSATLPTIATTTTSTTVVQTTTTVQAYYIVQRGDTLGKIAKAFHVRVKDLMALNGITDENKIQAGQELQIPTGAVVYDSLPPLDTAVTPTT